MMEVNAGYLRKKKDEKIHNKAYELHKSEDLLIQEWLMEKVS